MPARPSAKKKPQQKSRDGDYWCHPQAGGHPTLYFHGHELISRAEYLGAVGPEDCDPHIGTGRAIRKRGAQNEREQRRRM